MSCVPPAHHAHLPAFVSDRASPARCAILRDWFDPAQRAVHRTALRWLQVAGTLGCVRLRQVARALPEAALAEGAALVGEAARTAHMEGVTAAQEAEGIAWIANAAAAADHEFAIARPRLRGPAEIEPGVGPNQAAACS